MSLAAAILLAASQVSAFAIRGSVIASGGLGSQPAADATHQVVGTAGQPMTGVSSAGNTAVGGGVWWLGGLPVIAVGPQRSDLPRAFAFTLLSSNPTRGPAQLELALPRASRMTIRVFDVSGRRIGDPLDRRFEAGRHRLAWGADLRHPGVYFIRITSDAGFEAKRKVVLVR